MFSDYLPGTSDKKNKKRHANRNKIENVEDSVNRVVHCFLTILEPNYAAALSFLLHGVAPARASLTALMFFTPSVESQSSSAFTPLVA